MAALRRYKKVPSPLHLEVLARIWWEWLGRRERLCGGGKGRGICCGCVLVPPSCWIHSQKRVSSDFDLSAQRICCQHWTLTRPEITWLPGIEEGVSLSSSGLPLRRCATFASHLHFFR